MDSTESPSVVSASEDGRDIAARYIIEHIVKASIDEVISVRPELGIVLILPGQDGAESELAKLIQLCHAESMADERLKVAVNAAANLNNTIGFGPARTLFNTSLKMIGQSAAQRWLEQHT